MKNRIAKSVTCAALALSLGATAFPGQAQDYRMMTNGEDRSDAVLLDAVVVRPLTLASGIVGIGLWVVTLPFSLPGGSVEVAGKEFVGRPLEYTFTRPLGEWRFCGADRHPC